MDFADDIAYEVKVSKKPKRCSLESKISKMSRTKDEYRENEIHELQY